MAISAAWQSRMVSSVFLGLVLLALGASAAAPEAPQTLAARKAALHAEAAGHVHSALHLAEVKGPAQQAALSGVARGAEAGVVGAAGHQELAATKGDPRAEQRGKFGWLFKDAYSAKDKKEKEEASMMRLQNNGTEGTEGSEEDEAEASDAVAQIKAKAKSDEAKALEFSKGQEGIFIGGLLLSVIIVFGMVLCCIKYARTMLGGDSLLKRPPQQQQQGGPGGYGAMPGGP